MKNNKKPLPPDQQRQSFKKITESYFILIKIRLECFLKQLNKCHMFGWYLATKRLKDDSTLINKKHAREKWKIINLLPLYSFVHQYLKHSTSSIWLTSSNICWNNVPVIVLKRELYLQFLQKPHSVWLSGMRGHLSRFISKNLMYEISTFFRSKSYFFSTFFFSDFIFSGFCLSRFFFRDFRFGDLGSNSLQWY